MSLRLQCVLILQKILEENLFFNALKEELNPKDKPFANRLILTALRRKAAVDKLLSSLMRKPVSAKYNIIKYVLLAGSVELLYMQTPDYAVINEYVEMAKSQTDRFCAGMVNAVLRNVLKNKENMENQAFFPKSFAALLKKDYTPAQIKKMEEMLLIEPPLDVFYKENPMQVAKMLGGDLYENGSIRVLNPKANISLLSGYDEGLWWVQDMAASLPISLLQNLKGKKVLDLCAAPGGKTAQLLSKGAFVTALDISESRLNTLKENMSRLKLSENLTTLCEDALCFLTDRPEMFDLILLDAPCSATGTFRRHPEILHIKKADDVTKQSILQQRLLEAAAKRVAFLGKLLYCTCSLFQFEGEAQIELFLKEHSEFALKTFDRRHLNFPNAKKIDLAFFDKKFLRTLPYDMKNEGGIDGFFAACLERAEKKEK
ncbi:MAG: RsmD family RNA methyltransferase [Alphaproteobacteria bacterium]|nr:RsmD family RNA methyltransferase [Alphaproteobacteria bacterium]